MKKTKPIGQLIIILYFFPLIATLFFAFFEGPKSKTGFVWAVLAITLAALTFFLTLKKWEDEWKKGTLQKPAAPPQPAQNPKPNEEVAELKKKIALASEELSALRNQRKAYLEEKENTLLLWRQEKDELQRFLSGAQREKLEALLHLKMKETELDVLQKQQEQLKTDISNLHFEIKTLLKIGSSSAESSTSKRL